MPLVHTPTGAQLLNTGTCPDWELNRRSFTLQENTQSTESHWSGLQIIVDYCPVWPVTEEKHHGPSWLCPWSTSMGISHILSTSTSWVISFIEQFAPWLCLEVMERHSATSGTIILLINNDSFQYKRQPKFCNSMWEMLPLFSFSPSSAFHKMMENTWTFLFYKEICHNNYQSSWDLKLIMNL